MHLFNRILVLLLALLLLAGAGAVLLVAFGIAGPEQMAPSPWFRDRLHPFAALDASNRGQIVAAAILCLLVGLALLLVELRPARRPARLLLRHDALGSVTVALEGLRELARREAAGIEGVQDVQSRVIQNAGGLRILCRVWVDPGARLPELTRELQERVKAAVERHLGREVAEVHVDAQIAPAGHPRGRSRVH